MTYRTATVVSGVMLPDGTPWKKQSVNFKLNAPAAFTSDGANEITGSRYATQTDAGFTITLPINDDIDPAGTSWQCRVNGQPWTIQLRAAHAGQTVTLRSVIVADPTNPNPIVGGVSQAQLDAALAAFTPTSGALDGGDATGTFTGTTIDGGTAA